MMPAKQCVARTRTILFLLYLFTSLGSLTYTYAQPAAVATTPPAALAMSPPPDVAMNQPPDVAMNPPPDVAMNPPAPLAMNQPPEVAINPKAAVTITKPAVAANQPIPVAVNNAEDLGQTIQITTRFRSFVGKPIFTFIVRDVDQGIDYPYVYDITRGNNQWMLFTHTNHYLITASRLQIVSYRSRCNDYRNIRIKDFCQLESHGRIIRDRSLLITIEGDLSPFPDTYSCKVLSYPTGNFCLR